MGSEAKKLALLRILEILQKNTDEAHPLTHNEIADLLRKEYDIEIERKAVGRNISLLLEADYDIVTTKRGVSTYRSEAFPRSDRKACKRGKQVFS